MWLNNNNRLLSDQLTSERPRAATGSFHSKKRSEDPDRRD